MEIFQDGNVSRKKLDERLLTYYQVKRFTWVPLRWKGMQHLLYIIISRFFMSLFVVYLNMPDLLQVWNRTSDGGQAEKFGVGVCNFFIIFFFCLFFSFLLSFSC